MPAAELTELAGTLLAWYAQEKRRLPWRESADPYAIWVSEIMLQQTRVETAIPYFERWLARFPDISALAAADQQSVLAAWEGLGYYSRARNLHRAAQVIVADHQGVIPSDPVTLRSLPGIGRYTAGAIASIAFGQDEPVVDGNIRRVFARIFNISDPLGSAAAENQFWTLTEEHLPPGRAGDFNQALMDLGAAICLPREPRCGSCPLVEMCAAYELGFQDVRPVRKPKKDLPHYVVTAAVIGNDGQVLISRRPQEALLGGMWEFPGGMIEADESLAEGLRREIVEELGVEVLIGEPCGVYEHAYTHYKVTLHAFFCEMVNGSPQSIEVDEIQWVQPAELSDYPMGKIDRMISETILQRYTA